MIEAIQTFLAECGESACYALDIIKLAERTTGKRLDVIETLISCIKKGFIYYNWKNPDDNENFFVVAPDRMLSYLTGAHYTVRKYTANEYVQLPGDLIVERWERKRVGVTTGHFKLPDWDSLLHSQTVKYGTLVSYRVFRKA